MTETPQANELPINKRIDEDLKKEFKTILQKHLEGRTIKEDKINSWMDNVLQDAQEYFIKKYPDYDLFLFCFTSPRSVKFYGYKNSISLINIDWCDFASFQTNDIYSCLYYFFYKKQNLNYQIEDYENEIIQKGSEIVTKYLQDRKYGNECKNYNKYIHDDFIDYILGKNKSLRCFFLNHIYPNPIQGKYYFKYLTYGKQIYSKFFQTYENDSLNYCHYLFFFK